MLAVARGPCLEQVCASPRERAVLLHAPLPRRLLLEPLHRARLQVRRLQQPRALGVLPALGLGERAVAARREVVDPRHRGLCARARGLAGRSEGSTAKRAER